jgi:hypothetical protein
VQVLLSRMSSLSFDWSHNNEVDWRLMHLDWETSLGPERWRSEMNQEIDRINLGFPNTPSYKKSSAI